MISVKNGMIHLEGKRIDLMHEFTELCRSLMDSNFGAYKEELLIAVNLASMEEEEIESHFDKLIGMLMEAVNGKMDGTVS